MATGDKTYKGLAVPLWGESKIQQVAEGTDLLTLASVADKNTGGSLLELGITATSAQTAGYNMGGHVSMDMDGGGTGGQAVQSIAWAADITIDGTFSHGVYGAYYYFAEGSTGSTPTSGAMVGAQVYFAAFGAAMDYRVGFWATSAETNSFLANQDAAFMAECGAAGSWGTLLSAHGGPPGAFLKFTTAPGEDEMYSTGIRANVAAAGAWLKVDVNGTLFWIALHASCTS